MSFSICHICPSFNNNLYSQIVDRQISSGVAARVFYFRRKGQGLPNGEKTYVDGCMPFNHIDRFFFFVKESKVGRVFFSNYSCGQFNIIHAHTLFTSGYIALKARQKWNTPYVVAVRNSDINVFFKKRVYLRKTGVQILKNASKIVFISNSAKHRVLSTYIDKNDIEIIESKSCVIPNGIDVFWLNNIQTKIKNRVADDKTITLIYYGDIDKNKNLITSIKAAEILQKEGYSVVFYVAGKIKDNSVKRQIEEHAFIQYLGFLSKEELIVYLRKSDVFLMPSFSETFGLSYVEAMSQGVPIVYSVNQGFDGQYKEGEVGFHVNPKSPKSVSDAVVKIINDSPNINQRCIAHSKEYNWDSIVERYQDIYSDLL